MQMFTKISLYKSQDGGDGGTFPLLKDYSAWSFGQNDNCMIRIRRPGVAGYHCFLELSKKNASDYEFLLYTTRATFLNETELPTKIGSKIKHGDIIKIVGRQFRLEYPYEQRMRGQREITCLKTACLYFVYKINKI